MVTTTAVTGPAGVPTAIASHFIRATRSFGEGTRRLVLDTIDQTGYVHNTIARSLVTANTRTVGLAISAMSNPYFMDLVHAIETEIRQAGYTLLLADTRDDPEEELRVIQTLYQQPVDGILCAPSPPPPPPPLTYLANHNL